MFGTTINVGFITTAMRDEFEEVESLQHSTFNSDLEAMG